MLPARAPGNNNTAANTTTAYLVSIVTLALGDGDRRQQRLP